MGVTGDNLERLVPKPESKPRGPQAQKPLVATKLTQEIPDKQFSDEDLKVYKSPKKIVREKKTIETISSSCIFPYQGKSMPVK